MSYEVSFTDSVNKGSITVDDNSLNTETSLGLPGRNLTDYGNIVLENFLHLLENFANSNSPANPVEGQLWYDTTAGVEQLKVYDGTTWVSAGGLKKGNTQPEATTSIPGDLWVDTANQQVYLYTGSGWILVGPDFSQGASTGSKFVTLISSNNVEQPVIINYVDNQPVVIISATQFIPKSTINGFGTIFPGVNISSNVSGTPGKYYGISEKAENVLVNGVSYPGSAFARLDVSNIFTRALRVQNNGGVSIGETPTLVLSVSGSVSEIRNAASDGSIDFRVNNAGSTTTAMRIFNNTKIAIGTPTKIPTEALDVVGNIVATGFLALGSTTESTTINNGALVVPGGAGIAKNLNVGGNITIENGSNTLTVNDILPNVTNLKNLGSAALRFRGVYSQDFYGNLTGNVTGSVSGSSASAGKLNSPTTFSITGDITAPSVVFDGQVGGTTKNFVTTLSDSYFTSKTLISVVQPTDEILVNRTGDGLRRISQENFVSKIPNTAQGPLMPIGTVLPYVGDVAPAGFFICDGSEREVALYTNLYSVILNKFGVPSSISFFRLPDFRGRTLMGWLAGETTGNRVLTDNAVESIGGYGGLEKDLIDVTQLPEHYHVFLGDDGTQFYTVTNQVGNTDSASAAVNFTGTNVGTGMTRTQGIENFTTQQEFDTVPPFGTVNFIIYHGVF